MRGFGVADLLTSSSADIVRAVLLYLMQHPDATDSADGVQRWWLGLQFRERPLGEVEHVLNQLAGLNWVTVQVRVDGKKEYRLNKTRMGEIFVSLHKPRT